MGQRAHVVILPVVVKQHVGVNVVGRAVGVSPGGLTLVGIHVDPALRESAFRSRGVFGAKRGQSIQDVAFGHVDRIFGVDRRDERSIQIVIMEIGKLHHSFTEFQVSLKRWQIAIDALN